MNNPIEKKHLHSLLKLNSEGRVLKREGNSHEFKQSFDWNVKESKAKYIKTIAAFANRSGGYIVFGVKDKPKELLGIDVDFTELDDANIVSFLNNYLSPSVDFEREEVVVDGKRIGFIYIHESKNKPVICIKDHGSVLHESTIFYRYNSKSEKIKSGDLVQLLNEAREKESQKWINLFSKVASIGVDSLAVYNKDSGEISTSNNNRFILDENLIKRLQIIDKYSQEDKGAPAVRIIGEIDEVGTIIKQNRYLYDFDFMQAFLKGDIDGDPSDYLTGLCHQTAGILPIYFLLRKMNISINEGIEFLEAVKKNSSAKNKLISRLKDDRRLLNAKNNKSIKSTTTMGKLRNQYFGNLISETESAEMNSEGKVKRYMEAVLNLEPDSFNKDFVYSDVKKNLMDHYSNRDLSSSIREAISYLDLIENRHHIS